MRCCSWYLRSCIRPVEAQVARRRGCHMADAEVEETPQAETPSVSAEEVPATSTGLKDRIKRPVRPDESELKLQTTSLNEEIQRAKARIEEIKEEIGNRTSNRQKGSDEQQRVKGQLSELRAQFQSELVG